ncbi:hypothetical protein MMC28_002547 [Mycoblastus sanguinarius]|nr:hypothetical protein [Mycoblastus sanguinarius]
MPHSVLSNLPVPTDASLRPFVENVDDFNDRDKLRWEDTLGRGLVILLQNAGYSLDAQHRSLQFFQDLVVPRLGPAPWKHQRSPVWASFMTDDGLPIELSWDWGRRGDKPRVRFCMEPVGAQAGTSQDPTNRLAGPCFVEELQAAYIGFNDIWFNHLAQALAVFDQQIIGEADIHDSRMFLGFDLGDDGVATKAYFSSKFKAMATTRTDLHVLTTAIAGLPGMCPVAHAAFQKLAHFIERSGHSSNLELEGLSVDCVDPIRSRIKLYVRCVNSCLESIEEIITLGGELCASLYSRGLEELRLLWKLLFGEQPGKLTMNGSNSSRTAGIMYNFEFQRGLGIPIPKVYIPVRHYCPSDEHILQGLEAYFRLHGDDDAEMQSYIKAIRTML